MATDQCTCRVCGAVPLIEFERFRQLPRVTSDCVPFRSGGRLLACATCGAAQSPADEQWFQEIAEIYSSYYAYHQSGGIEQSVPDGSGHALAPRSAVFVSRLLMLGSVPRQGRLLDVGCGTGGTLRAFAERGDWRLFGLELDDRNLRFLMPIQQFETLYTCPPEDLPGAFDIITLVHTLEHFPDPLAVLKCLTTKLVASGKLFIEVPNAAANPFDYLIADHMLHFTPATLSLVLERSGLGVDCLATDWVPKELSATAALRLVPRSPSAPPIAAEESRHAISSQIDWLVSLLESARAALQEGPQVGLFGSSIAATWLCGALPDGISFFVDEDPNRIGRTHMNRPILGPDRLLPGSIVLMPMVPQIAERVAQRWRGAPVDLRVPPPLPL